ncbi:MAG: 1,4-dihydroxy-6-naphthoate synthase [Taibaiella sp.]|nr:1,4-dihydroxy-6-naphthoate synthase [Taibaiella sp.]
MKLTLGFSPCPNDTFIFDAMVNGKIDTRGLVFDYVLEDVETLNKWAFEEKLDITKLSYSSYLHLADKYALLNSGSALGKGVGPLLIARFPMELADLENLKVAIPGENTTANLLLSLALPGVKNKKVYVFNEIEDAVLNGEVDAGLIIHENRFTYQAKGLHKLIDLGDWWEQNVQAAIPLGGIVARRSFDDKLLARIDMVIKESVLYSWKHYPQLSDFITCHAQEMDEQVMRQHIELYVNEYTTDLGATGIKAVETMFAKAKEVGIINKLPGNIFY